MKTINLKPIEYDVHFKFLCPNSSCCYPHWLSLKEASLKDFKVVCECGTVFSVKQIEKIKVKYIDNTVVKKRDIFAERQIKQPEPIELAEIEPKIIVDESIEPSENTVTKAKNLLSHYGFSVDEAEQMIEKTLSENPGIDDYMVLVKHSLFLVKND